MFLLTGLLSTHNLMTEGTLIRLWKFEHTELDDRRDLEKALEVLVSGYG